MTDLDELKKIGAANLLEECVEQIKMLLHLDSEEEAADLADEDLLSFSKIAQNLCEDIDTLCAAMANYGFIGGLKQKESAGD